MELGRLAIVALICFMAARESISLAAERLDARAASTSSRQDESPLPNQDPPLATDGEEIKGLSSERSDEVSCPFVISPDSTFVVSSVSGDRIVNPYSSSRDLLKVLQRLRV